MKLTKEWDRVASETLLSAFVLHYRRFSAGAGEDVLTNKLAGDGAGIGNLRQPVETVPAGIADFYLVDIDIA